jgi:hypothetical protein
VRVSTVIEASPRRVWDEVRDIGSHVEWMADARAIRFTSHQRTGVGTTFECDTALGPLRLTDHMEVTEWDEGRTIGIRHVGLVTGTGRLTVRRRLRGGTRFTWHERLHLPWWMGGPVGGLAASPVLHAVWARSLRNLRSRIEGSAGSRRGRGRGGRRRAPAS